MGPSCLWQDEEQSSKKKGSSIQNVLERQYTSYNTVVSVNSGGFFEFLKACGFSCPRSKILIINDMLHVTSLTRLPFFSRVYVEKIGEPGDEASVFHEKGVRLLQTCTVRSVVRATILVSDPLLILSFVLCLSRS